MNSMEECREFITNFENRFPTIPIIKAELIIEESLKK